ncbi:hypothetical protein C8Q69DRAFT_135612 [Paecilomyces variotii]|uniref:Uncharacterized protein n=1 Tax=Byssochlamys spectabilis TaxID=264951 RepID=A0A443I031_BYSSP|nr:hypothetical protein C8Q69DRAFT_135612 [Paecilomyces variotii]RWQ97418.1 hypothetical protein C8Q69DRAFT_135612 [Paecilomyces variotii]
MTPEPPIDACGEQPSQPAWGLCFIKQPIFLLSRLFFSSLISYCFGTGYAVVWFTTLPILLVSALPPVCRLLQLGGRGSFICGVESVHKCCYCYPLWKSMRKTCLLPLAVLFLYGLSLFSF